MESFWSFIYADLIQHPLIFSLVVIIVVQVQALKKEVRVLYRDFLNHIKEHAKGEL